MSKTKNTDIRVRAIITINAGTFTVQKIAGEYLQYCTDNGTYVWVHKKMVYFFKNIY